MDIIHTLGMCLFVFLIILEIILYKVDAEDGPF